MKDTVNLRKYALFFHGSCRDSQPETHGAASLAVVFTDDFTVFYDSDGTVVRKNKAY